jgi:hypothetical protein
VSGFRVRIGRTGIVQWLLGGLPLQPRELALGLLLLVPEVGNALISRAPLVVNVRAQIAHPYRAARWTWRSSAE